ncbi:ExeA family protein [uncultured Tateyamaria sp.]|uniref:ExeA family protein n=1 Tax=uncultured Tateyamaria sp. TaxID=455651 RepID=UPI0026147DEB|nr:AAA family ATPase [uncultured Tateyamaria sp.]
MKTDLYLKHFQFRERPFALLPDPDFIFWSKGHTRAFSVLEYGLITQAPITVLTGEVGAGKTTLLQALIAQVDRDVVVGLISNAQGGRGELLRWVLNAFDQHAEPQADYVALHQQFVDFVLSQYAAGHSVLLIIDEAQNLSSETLEELRMLTNINSGKDELLQLVLLGQPELREMISQPELRQFAQRVSVSYHLEPMDRATSREYIRSRLLHVDGSGEEFTEHAMALIHQISGGVPREINKLCDLALVYAVSADKMAVDGKLIEELLADGVILTAPIRPLFLSNRYAVDMPDNHSGEAAE